MSDFIAALGLVFVLEGLLFAAFPDLAKRAMESVMQASDNSLRIVGLVSAILGIALLWIIRG